MMGERATITSSGSVDELRCRRVNWGECVVAELAQEMVGAPAEFARDREAGAVVVDPLGDVQVVGVVGRRAAGGALGGLEQCPTQKRGALM
jgi:hypothetical protein